MPLDLSTTRTFRLRSSTDGLVAIGRIVKPHGLHGELAVDPLSDVPDRFAVGISVTVGSQQTRIASSRPHQGRHLIQFDHVRDRTGAEQLRGELVYADPIDESNFPTYFAHELVGLRVVGVDGQPLGFVTALIELPDAAEYDLLEVDDGTGTIWLLPTVEDFVDVRVDEDGKLLQLTHPPDGLLDVQSPS